MSEINVGDRLRVIDESGHGAARMGDLVTVTRLTDAVSFIKTAKYLVGVKADDGRHFSMFDFRFEKIEPETAPESPDFAAIAADFEKKGLALLDAAEALRQLGKVFE